jgi:hypothetical protein
VRVHSAGFAGYGTAASGPRFGLPESCRFARGLADVKLVHSYGASHCTERRASLRDGMIAAMADAAARLVAIVVGVLASQV